jgi:hypothetical protein
MKLNIYIASSWKNQHAVEMLTDLLRKRGHSVHSFVENAQTGEGKVSTEIDLDKWIESEEGRQKFLYDTSCAMTDDLVIYIGPSGTDAWAEVGAAFASGTTIIGLWAKGEPAGLMRRMVTKWFNNYFDMCKYIDPLITV